MFYFIFFSLTLHYHRSLLFDHCLIFQHPHYVFHYRLLVFLYYLKQHWYLYYAFEIHVHLYLTFSIRLCCWLIGVLCFITNLACASFTTFSCIIIFYSNIILSINRLVSPTLMPVNKNTDAIIHIIIFFNSILLIYPPNFITIR